MRKNSLIIAAACVLAQPALLAAAAITPADLANPVLEIICGLFNAVRVIAGAIASLVLVWAAIKYISSEDDPGARKYTKDAIRYVIIGLIIIMLSEAIVIYIAPPALSRWCTIF